MNTLDSAPHTMKAAVVNPYFDWGNDQHPNISYHDSVIYEAHVRGMTNLNMDVPPDIRGTYAGLAYPSVIEYLKKLGVTAIELMPIHQFVNDSFLQEKGLSNYWGYNTIASSPRTTPTPAPGSAANRSTSSNPWSRHTIVPAWKSSSTWYTTIPPKATIADRPSASRASTTALLPSGRQRPQTLLRHHRHRKLAAHAFAARVAAHYRQPALLGH